MQIAKNKTAVATLALILMLSITATLVVFPLVSAHTPAWTIPTSSYVVVTPSTVGLGQYATIVVFVDRYSPTAGGGSGQRWSGFLITITKPDNTVVTIGPFECASDVGSDFRQYTPDQLGTYKIVFSWPGETAEAAPGHPSSSPYIGDYYEGSTSDPAYLTVQQQPVTGFQEPPLPTGYWQLPITDINRGWSSLASNWLKGSWTPGNFQPAGTAPESAHVLWSRYLIPAYQGGIIDAQWGEIPADVSDYESPWTSPIIMDGKIYYNAPPVADSATYGYYCVDLYTGEQLWYKNGTDNGLNNPYTMSSGNFGGGAPNLAESFLGLSLGQLKYYYSVNGQGVLSYLWMQSGTTWYMLDAATGNWILTLVHVPSGSSAVDQDGNLLVYTYNTNTGNILCWNSSQAIPPGGPVGTVQQQWKPRMGAVIDAVNDTTWVGYTLPGTVDAPATARPRSGYTMNVTVEAGLPLTVAFGAAGGGFSAILQDDKRVPKQLFGFYRAGGSTIGADPSGDNPFQVWLIGINDHATDYSPLPDYSASQQTNLGFTATVLWNKNISLPLPGKNYTWNLAGVSYDDQVFCITCKQTAQLWGYSLKDGSLLWGPTPARFNQIDFYGVGGNFYYGKYMSVGYGGTLYAYDAQTGALLWTYNDTAPAYESPYGDNFPLSIGAVCDGKVYLYSSEHSPTKPLWRPYLICVNATDGTEIWKLLDYNMGMGVADGYIVTASIFDNKIYCIGKGPSATTVSAPQSGVTLGSSFTITGTVTDQSPGALDIAKKMGYTNGVACVSDADQQAWMQYLYEQQAYPSTITGVSVSLDVYDPNGNYVHIGDATSDLTGFYSFQVDANMLAAGSGKYTVVATFVGSASYGSSFAETAFTVNPAPAATPPIEYPQPIDYTMTIVVAVIVILIAVAIATILILRKHP
jgi:outer membrane protein assembly factor BamB